MNVVEKGQYKILYMNGTVQSVMDILDPYKLVVPYTYAFQEKAKEYFPFSDVLFIGGGACLVPRAFIKTFNCNCDVVEIDNNVIKIAYEQFGLKTDSRLNIFQDEGSHFMEHCLKKYDVIILDAYDGFNIPKHMVTREFYDLINDRLNNGGVVISNYFGKKEHVFNCLKEIMSDRFLNLQVIQVTPINPQGENYIMVSQK